MGEKRKIPLPRLRRPTRRCKRTRRSVKRGRRIWRVRKTYRARKVGRRFHARIPIHTMNPTPDGGYVGSPTAKNGHCPERIWFLYMRDKFYQETYKPNNTDLYIPRILISRKAYKYIAGVN